MKTLDAIYVWTSELDGEEQTASIIVKGHGIMPLFTTSLERALELKHLVDDMGFPPDVPVRLVRYSNREVIAYDKRKASGSDGS